jgi:nucleotide-binding universal stress UspA family protein
LRLYARLGSIARAVIERSPVPVVLLPLHYRESLPWTSMLAAASGEASADQALEAAVHLAAALRLNVTVVHSGDGPPGAAPLGAYADAPYHEYPQRLKQLVERGLAGCAAEEARCVHEVLLCQGEPASVLLEQVAATPAVCWRSKRHGALGSRRARCSAPAGRSRMRAAHCSWSRVRRARLKVGSEMGEG